MSDAGQEILGEEFVTLPEDQRVQNPTQPSGTETLEIGGSTSITETMDKLCKAYTALYPNITFNLTSNGSGPGAEGAADGSYDIGMCSRDLKDSEIEKGLISHEIGKDGVAVIVNIDGDTAVRSPTGTRSEDLTRLSPSTPVRTDPVPATVLTQPWAMPSTDGRFAPMWPSTTPLAESSVPLSPTMVLSATSVSASSLQSDW